MVRLLPGDTTAEAAQADQYLASCSVSSWLRGQQPSSGAMDLLGEYDEEEDSNEGSPSSAKSSGQEAVEEPVSAGAFYVEGEPDGKSSPPPFWHGAAGAVLPPGQLERLRGVGSNVSGAGTPSDMSSPASESGEVVFDVAQPGAAANGSASTPGSADLPAAPPGPVEEAVKANVAKLYASLKTGQNINSDLRDKKEFHNPGILERLVSEFKIKESGTNYNAEIFSPDYPRDLYFDALNQQAARRDALNRATRTSIGFDSGGVQKPDYPARPTIQHAAGAASTAGSNQQSAVAVAAAATALAAAHGVAGGAGSSATHPPPTAAATEGPVKKKSKWDSAISNKNAAAAAPPAGAPPLRPPLPPNASVPSGLQPNAVLLQQQLLQQQILMRQQQQQLASKR